MLGDLSGVSKIFVITGRTDMRKSFDGLMAIIRDTYELDPYANAVYLFCVNNPVPVSLLSGDRKPQIRFLGNHHSGSGNLYHKSFRM